MEHGSPPPALRRIPVSEGGSDSTSGVYWLGPDELLAILTALLDGVAHGVAVVNGQAQVQVLNRAARAIMASRDGLSIVDGRLGVGATPANAVLQEAVAQAAGRTVAGVHHPAGVVAVPRPSGRAPYVLVIESLAAFGRGRGSKLPVRDGLAVVIINDPAMDCQVWTAELSDLFGLTQAESRLAAQIAAGLGAPEAAERLDISVNTARTHLKRVFAKTGTASQTELALLLAGVAVRLAPRSDE